MMSDKFEEYMNNDPNLNVQDPMFVATTCRYVFYTLSMAATGGLAAALMGIGAVNPLLNFAVSIGLIAKTLWETKINQDHESGLKWLMGFAAWTGFSLSSVLSLVAANVVGGPMIIAMALITTAVQVGALTYYSFYKANYSDSDMSPMGALLSQGLTGLICLGLFNAFLGMPFSYLMHAVLGNLVFSAYLVFDIQMIKKGLYDTPIEAALNVFLDIVNLFVDMVQIMLYYQTESENFNDHVSEFFTKRVLPIALVALALITFSKYETYNTETKEMDADQPKPSFISWLMGRDSTSKEEANEPSNGEYSYQY